MKRKQSVQELIIIRKDLRITDITFSFQCFMNSVTQCLSNTRCLLEYLVRDGFNSDINTTISTMKGDLVQGQPLHFTVHFVIQIVVLVSLFEIFSVQEDGSLHDITEL